MTTLYIPTRLYERIENFCANMDVNEYALILFAFEQSVKLKLNYYCFPHKNEACILKTPHDLFFTGYLGYGYPIIAFLFPPDTKTQKQYRNISLSNYICGAVEYFLDEFEIYKNASMHKYFIREALVKRKQTLDKQVKEYISI